VQELAAFGTATVFEASGRRGMLAPEIRPLWPGARASGRARCVRCGPHDNLALHRALSVVEAGEVLVVAGGDRLYGAWGEVMTEAALARGVVGLVTEGAVRDSEAIERLGFPVFSIGIAVGGCSKADRGSLDCKVVVGGAAVRPGDVVIGDADGVVVVAAEQVEAVTRAAREREERERAWIVALREGRTTLELMGLDGA